jgi:hypothetical protein
LHEKQHNPGKESNKMFEFWSIVVLVVGLPLIAWLAWAVDHKNDFFDNEDEDEIKPLLGVVAPKTKEKEEK